MAGPTGQVWQHFWVRSAKPSLPVCNGSCLWICRLQRCLAPARRVRRNLWRRSRWHDRAHLTSGWILAFLVAGALIARPVDGAEGVVWSFLVSRVGVPAAVVVVCVAFVAVAVTITAGLGLVRLPARRLRVQVA